MRSFESSLTSFLEELRLRRRSLSSIAHAQRVLPRLFLHLRKHKLRDPRAVTAAQLASFARHLADLRTKKGEALAPWTQASYLSTVKGFFRFLAKRGLILHDPARDLVLPKAQSLPRFLLSEAEARRLMNAPGDFTVLGKRDRAILETLYGTAIRRSECVRLDLTDLDLLAGTLLIRNGKGRKDRIVPLAGRAEVALDRYLRESRPELLKDSRESALFLQHRGGAPLSRAALGFIVRRHAKAAGIPYTVSPHLLRHACATHLLKGGADIRHVQALLGHRLIRTTALYTSLTVKDLKVMLERSHPRERDFARRRLLKPR